MVVHRKCMQTKKRKTKTKTKNKNKNKKEKLEEKISGNEYYTQKTKLSTSIEFELSQFFVAHSSLVWFHHPIVEVQIWHLQVLLLSLGVSLCNPRCVFGIEYVIGLGCEIRPLMSHVCWICHLETKKRNVLLFHSYLPK